jgi:hypothetical protein
MQRKPRSWLQFQGSRAEECNRKVESCATISGGSAIDIFSTDGMVNLLAAV